MSYRWREYGDYNEDYKDQKYLLIAEIYATGYLIQAIQVKRLYFYPNILIILKSFNYIKL